MTSQDERNVDLGGSDNSTASEARSQKESNWGYYLGKRAPNVLTGLRLLAVPVFVLLLVEPTPVRCLWATVIFITASATDWLDGYIARAYKAESILGTVLDPLADKILVMSALVMMAATPFEPHIPAWMVVVLLTREFIVTGLRSLAAVQGVVVPASSSAKYKTGWTMAAVIFLLIKQPYRILGINFNFFTLGMFCLWVAMLLSVFSGIQYAIRLRKVFL